MNYKERLIKALREIYSSIEELMSAIEDGKAQDNSGEDAEAGHNKPSSAAEMENDEFRILLMSKNTAEVMKYLKSKGYAKYTDIPQTMYSEISEAIREFKDR